MKYSYARGGDLATQRRPNGIDDAARHPASDAPAHHALRITHENVGKAPPRFSKMTGCGRAAGVAD
jgi:hypothetical protein